MRNWRNIVLFVSTLLFAIACANNPIRSYKNDSDEMLKSIHQKSSEIAVESSNFGNPKDPDILFFMEYGTYLRMTANYTSSDLQFAKAQKIVDIWVNSWKNTTSGNIGTTATQMLINDNATDYEPKGYEKTMLATYRALDHIDNNNWDYGRIEIKKMYEVEQAIANYNQALYMQEQADAQKRQTDKQQNELYNKILQKYDFSDINSPQVLALKNSYQNAFSHYLAGFVFEALGEPSLSRPGYLKAGQLAPFDKLPQQSIDNLDNGKQVKAGYADVLIIQEIGHAPQLKSEEVHIPFIVPVGQSHCVTNINLFFPRLVPDKTYTSDIDYSIDNAQQSQELFTNFDLMAARSLHDNMPHIIARNISSAIRNIASSSVSCSAGGSMGGLLNLGTIIAGYLLDKADERTWVLLPNKVYLNRVQLPLGKHNFRITVNGQTYNKSFTLSGRYQIIDMRVLDGKLYFDTATTHATP